VLSQNTPLTVAEYRALSARAEASRRSRMVRARRIAAEAGVDPGMPFHLAHNAMVGLHYGQPWKGVDYSKVRLLMRLERELFTADRIVNRIYSRRGMVL
jgi:hypothetical protein